MNGPLNTSLLRAPLCDANKVIGDNNFVGFKVSTRAGIMVSGHLPSSLPFSQLEALLCEGRQGVPLDGQLLCLWPPPLNDGKGFFVGFNQVNKGYDILEHLEQRSHN